MTETTPPESNQKSEGFTYKNFVDMMRNIVLKLRGENPVSTSTTTDIVPPLARETDTELRAEVKQIVARGGAKTGESGRAGKIPPADGAE